MLLETLLQQVRCDGFVVFEEALQVIAEHYDYQPAAFKNGPVSNAAGQNEGSCKLFAFARRHGLSAEQTLALFGQHYHDVLADPLGDKHANIRAFMQQGWDGVWFESEPLTPKAAGLGV